MTLTDKSPMPFGFHKDKPMEKVPAAYLLWMWEDFMHDRSACRNVGTVAVHDYVKENFSALEKEYPNQIITHRP